jgi:hypothetical protein
VELRFVEWLVLGNFLHLAHSRSVIIIFRFYLKKKTNH